MADLVANRNTALNRLLEEFERPPPVPPKDDALQLDSAQDVFTQGQKPIIQASTLRPCIAHRTNASKDCTSGHDDRVSSEAEIKSQIVTTRPKKVAFAQHDALSPPPVSLDKESFQSELVPFQLNASTSVFDPPPAPRFSRFPDQLPEVAKRKPAPLNLNQPTSQTGKWKVRKEDIEDAWTPIEDEPDTASIISMEVRNAPRLCPLPYKPIRSVPLRTRGSLRPAPLRIRKGVRFDGAKSPGLPLKSPALLSKRVRFDNVKSPATTKFRTPPTPFSSSHFMVLSPGRKNGVRFAAVKSPAISNFKTPPTPYYRNKFQIPVSTASKRNVRFDSIKSPATSRFKVPPTPCYEDNFRSPALDKGVRFADIASPAVSNFHNPPTPYHKAKFGESASPPDQSPVTPRAMHMTIPVVESDSPSWSQSHHTSFDDADARGFTKFKPQLAPEAHDDMKFPPRTTSLQHRRNASLPQTLDQAQAILPSTTFDESAVGESTLRWLGMLPKSSYRVNEQVATSDRHQILGSYFHSSRPSF